MTQVNLGINCTAHSAVCTGLQRVAGVWDRPAAKDRS